MKYPGFFKHIGTFFLYSFWTIFLFYWINTHGCGQKFTPTTTYHKSQRDSTGNINFQLKSTGNINIDGKKDGVWIKYYENGDLDKIENYKDGKRDGLQKYFDNNSLKIDINFKDGKEDGLFKFYYKNGQLQTEGNNKDGKIYFEKCWDKNGEEIECEPFP